MLTDLNGLIIGLVCVETLFVMARWHFIGRGKWRHYPSGRSVMWLLACIAAITALAAFSTFVGVFPGRASIYTVLYCALLVAVALIGTAIISAQRTRSREDDSE